MSEREPVAGGFADGAVWLPSQYAHEYPSDHPAPLGTRAIQSVAFAHSLVTVHMTGKRSPARAVEAATSVTGVVHGTTTSGTYSIVHVRECAALSFGIETVFEDAET